MGGAKVKAEAMLLAALVLASCFAVSSSNCIPRRLLVLSPYQRPCNDDVNRDRTTTGQPEPNKQAAGWRSGKAPPPPTAGLRHAAMEPKAPSPGGED